MFLLLAAEICLFLDIIEQVLPTWLQSGQALVNRDTLLGAACAELEDKTDVHTFTIEKTVKYL